MILMKTKRRLETQYLEILNRYGIQLPSPCLEELISAARPEKKKAVEDETPPKATTRQITDRYVELLGGHDPAETNPRYWGTGESTAAKAIGKYFTVDEFSACYVHFKGQRYWQDKHLRLSYIALNIRSYHSSPAPESRFGLRDRPGKAPEGL